MAIEIAENYLNSILRKYEYLEGIVLTDKEGIDIYSAYGSQELKENPVSAGFST